MLLGVEEFWSTNWGPVRGGEESESVKKGLGDVRRCSTGSRKGGV